VRCFVVAGFLLTSASRGPSAIAEPLVTARRYAKRDICRRRVSVRLSICVSVTLKYRIKTAKRRMTQIMPYDSPLTLVF